MENIVKEQIFIYNEEEEEEEEHEDIEVRMSDNEEEVCQSIDKGSAVSDQSQDNQKLEQDCVFNFANYLREQKNKEQNIKADQIPKIEQKSNNSNGFISKSEANDKTILKNILNNKIEENKVYQTQKNNINLKVKFEIEEKNNQQITQIYKQSKQLNQQNHIKINNIKKETNSLYEGNIQGLRIHQYQYEIEKNQYLQDKKALKVSNMKSFLSSRISSQYKITALIKKQSSSFFNFGVKYSVNIKQNHKFLFSVLKVGLSDFIFSLSKENISTTNKNYLGKMTNSFMGFEFILYDHGFDPSSTRLLQFCRHKLAEINYQKQKGLRKMIAFISSDNKGEPEIQNSENFLQHKWKKNKKNEVTRLRTKIPEYDSQDKCFKLDFKGMMLLPSVKNLILTNDEDQDSLIFGRISQDEYVMEIKSPLSVIQACAICISSIHYKNG